MSYYQSLVDKYERTKSELGETEFHIRRLTGRDPDEIGKRRLASGKFVSTSTTRPSGASYSGRKRPIYLRRQSAEQESSFEDNSDEEEEDDGSPNKKPTLQSTIVAKKSPRKSRKATIEEQNANSKVVARNRRMFGALIGTLEKFQHEEKTRQHKESMRAEIEQKVEAAREEEQEKVKQEKELLLHSRREKQTQLRCLEKKIERAESHEVYDSNHRQLQNYIMTKSKPPIFFLPSSHTSQSRKCHEESKHRIEGLLKKRKEGLDLDLKEIEEWYRKDSMPVDKENKCPKDEAKSQDGPETVSEAVIEQEDTNLDDGSQEESSEDSTSAKPAGSFVDQDFEPIYD